MAKLALQTKLENSREGRTFLKKTRKITCLVLFCCFEKAMDKVYLGEGKREKGVQDVKKEMEKPKDMERCKTGVWFYCHNCHNVSFPHLFFLLSSHSIFPMIWHV